MSRKINVLRSMVVLLVFIFALQFINIMDVKAAYKTVDLVYVDTFPAKIEYDTFDEIDATGGIIGILYKDGSIDKISMKPEMLSGYDMSVVGEQRVVITSNKKEVSSYMITVREVSPQYVTLNEYELNLVAGKAANLYAVVSPSNTTDKTVTYKSEDEKIARVSTDGIVYAVGEGTVNIIAEAKNGKKAVCKVNVRVEANNIYYPYGNYDYVTMQIYQVKDNQLIVIPSEAAKTVSYSSNNVLVATVDKYGKVTAVGPGKAEITARTPNGLFAKFVVKVENPIKEVDIPEEKSIVVGTSIVISDWDIKIKGKYSGFAPTEELDFSVGNPEIASIVGKNALITHKSGTTYIYYLLNGVRIAKTKLNVLDIEATDIKLSKNELELYVTENEKLKAKVNPKGVTERIIWKSDNPSIAIVDENGNIKAISEGTTNIFYESESGIKDVCVVTIKKMPDPVLVTKNLQLKKEITLKPSIPSGGKWEIDDPDGILSKTKENKNKLTIKAQRGGKAKIVYKKGVRSTIYTINVPATKKNINKTIRGRSEIELKPGFTGGTWQIESNKNLIELSKNNQGNVAKVKAKKAGKYVVTYDNGVDIATYIITAKDIKATEMRMKSKKIRVSIGNTKEVSCILTPSYSSTIWSIEDKSVASIVSQDGGKCVIKGKKIGKTKVVCISGDKKISCDIEVDYDVSSDEYKAALACFYLKNMYYASIDEVYKVEDAIYIKYSMGYVLSEKSWVKVMPVYRVNDSYKYSHIEYLYGYLRLTWDRKTYDYSNPLNLSTIEAITSTIKSINYYN